MGEKAVHATSIATVRAASTNDLRSSKWNAISYFILAFMALNFYTYRHFVVGSVAKLATDPGEWLTALRGLGRRFILGGYSFY
jgi:hypothetical protein